MIIGIDGSNIRTGGGKKHLEQFIVNSNKIFEYLNNKKLSNIDYFKLGFSNKLICNNYISIE